MIYLLMIDTSADTGTVAISADGRLLASRASTEARNHATAINLMIEGALADAGITMAQLSGVVVCAGPGSYTGLRIGMATAKGICYALDIPLILHNKLTLLAQQDYALHGTQYARYAAVLVAREQEYFAAIYDAAFYELQAPKHFAEEELLNILKSSEKLHISTDAVEPILIELKVNNSEVESDIAINLMEWSAYAYSSFKCNSNVNLHASEPFYLKQVYTHK
jgi:tRNA threonylcarbamoyladenosine biosynthesis protein TsaB